MKIYKLFFIIIIIFLYYKILYLNSNFIPKLKVCLCVIGKNENLYIKEFVDYYKNLGYNHIYLYDNNDINDEKFDEVIKEEIDNGFVSLIDYRGYRGINIYPQIEAYKDCYQKNNRKYDWLSFFDVDEYLQLFPSYLKIQNFLGNERFKHCENVKLNWFMYKNNNSLYYENKPLQKRVNIPVFNDRCNIVIKSTVRGNLSRNYWSFASTPHSSDIKFNCCSSSGKYINYNAVVYKPPDYKYAYLKHLQNKSFEEFCLKIKRGIPVRENQNIQYKKSFIKGLIEYNKNNKEKMNIINKIFNLSSYKNNNFSF